MKNHFLAKPQRRKESIDVKTERNSFHPNTVILLISVIVFLCVLGGFARDSRSLQHFRDHASS
jgi:hypothetical protein